MRLLVYFTSERLFTAFSDLGYIVEIKRFYPNVRFVCMKHNSVWQPPSTINDSSFDIEFITENNINKRFGKFVLDFFTYVHREVSVSFQTKIRIEAKIPINKTISLKTFVLQFKLRWILISILGLVFLKKIARVILPYLADNFFSNRIISKNFVPECLLLISGGPFSNVENSTIYHAHKLHVKCALIVDNWDNLSSKSIIWRKPDLMGVWGPNMLNDAIDIHGIREKTISTIGSSRMCEYSQHTQRESIPYVLFAGSSSDIGEIELIQISLKVLRESGIKLLYRPHPVSNKRRSVDLTRLNPSVLSGDLEIVQEADFYSFQSLSSLMDQCKSAAFVIASHSTVIVESLFLGKQVVSFSRIESPYFYNNNLWNGYKHLQELNDNVNLRICSDLDEFYDKIRDLTIEFKSGLLNKSDLNFVPEILPDFQNSYRERIIEFIHKLAKSSNKSLRLP